MLKVGLDAQQKHPQRLLHLDYSLHIFDMTKPPRPYSSVTGMYGLKTSMPLRKHIQGAHGGWTITDANLSPDNSRYSAFIFLVRNVQRSFPWQINLFFDGKYHCSFPRSLPIPIWIQSSTVYMTNTSPEESSEQIAIPFGDRTRGYVYGGQSRIWSCRFSADGNEVVAGGDGKIFGMPIDYTV